jgi:cytochrome c553
LGKKSCKSWAQTFIGIFAKVIIMRQSVQISKLTCYFASLLGLGLTILTLGFAAPVFAKDAAPAAQAATKSPLVPGQPKTDLAAGESLYNAGDATRGVVACITCHGPKGQSVVGTWPKLAAQHPAYLATQLKNYKEGVRANAVMMGMAAALTPQDMVNISAWLAKQEPSQGVAQDKQTIELGQSIYRGGIAAKGVPSCAGCHGANGAGVPSQYPRQAGQWAEYSNSQLMNFRDGTRKNVQMNMISAKLSDLEMKAVSDYMAGLH